MSKILRYLYNMSVIAVKKNKSNIVIGADSQVSFGGNKSIESNSKLIKLNNKLVVGAAGQTRILQLFKLFMQTNQLPEINEREIVSLFNKFELWLMKETSDNSTTSSTNEFILIQNKKIFCFANYYVREIQDFFAIGSGADKAMMSLDLGFSVDKTIKTVCKYDLYCHEPVEIITISI